MEKSLQILSERTLTAAEQTPGAPIFLTDLRVAYDYTYNREVLYIRGTNRCRRTLRSVYFDLTCLDDAGDCLGTANGACIRSLSTEPGAVFGEDTPVVIPFAGTCRVELALQKVVFADGTVWRSGDAPIEMPAIDTPADESSTEEPAPEETAPAQSAEPEAVSSVSPTAKAAPAEPEPAPIPAEWLNPPATAEGYRAAAAGLSSLEDTSKTYLIKKFTLLADKLEAEAAESARKAAEAEAAAKREADYKALLPRRAETADEWEALAADWSKLGSYKDAARRADEAKKKAKSIRTSEKRLAAKRAEEEKLAALAAAEKRKRIVKRTAVIGTIVLAVAAVLVLIFAVVIPAIDQKSYEEAEAYLANGEYTAAIHAFEDLKDYERAKAIRLELTGREDGIFLTSAAYPCYTIENGVLTYNSAQYRISAKTLRVPDYFDDQKVTALTANCFADLTTVEAVELPPSVTVIGNGAFQGCTSLTAFAAPNLTTIGAEAFRGCTALTEFVAPEKVTSIGANAFQGCSALKKAVLPDGLRKLSDALFLNCTALTEVVFGDRITAIGTETFAYCVSLPSVTLPETLTSIGNNAFLACNSFTALTIPDSVTSMGDKAMASCLGLTEVRLGTGLKKLAARTFEGSKALKTVYLSASLTQVGYAAFQGCTALTDLHFAGTAEDWAKVEVQADNAPLTAATLHSAS